MVVVVGLEIDYLQGILKAGNSVGDLLFLQVISKDLLRRNISNNNNSSSSSIIIHKNQSNEQ